MMGLSCFVPLTTRPCEYEVHASSDCSSLSHWAVSVAPRATIRCQAPWLNWVATLFSKIQAPLLQSGIFYPGWDGLPRSQDTRLG
jgi:hypothetical protein